MRYFRFLIIGVLCLSTLLAATRHLPVTTAQDQTQPVLVMTGLQLADQVRYSLTLGNTLGISLSNLQVQIQLPGDATFVQALEAPGVTQFLGNQSGTLTWSATSFSATDAIDPFVFSLQQPSTSPFAVHATWNGDNPGQFDTQLQPTVASASATSGQLVLTADLLNGGFVPVGDTGVLVAPAGGAVPAGTTITVRRLGPDSNPPGGTGDFWWCAIVTIDGLPADASLQVIVPTRQPLAPGAAITLFAQAGNTWSQTGQQGIVTADGQAISYLHTGGTLAAGTSPSFQQLPASLRASILLPPIDRLNINALSNAVDDNRFVLEMVSPANCNQSGNPCHGLPTCSAGALSSGNACANKGFDVNFGFGNTQCFNAGSNCVGVVPELAGGRVVSGPGHGTSCSFPSFTQTAPFHCSEH
ncbi:MAG: hypothetical protein ACR2PL_19485 [Dehalococcoidia bacterium]